jgi:hypothetical protein
MLANEIGRIDSSNEFAATREELDTFNEQGFFIRESVFNEVEVDILRNAVEGIHQRIDTAASANDGSGIEFVDDKRYQEILDSVVKWEWSEGSKDIRSMEPFLHLHPDLQNLVDDARLWAPAKSVLGIDDLSLFTDKLNFKRPHGAPFPFHQDSPYFAMQCGHVDQLFSLQIYLDDTTVENGCLWMIPGSHKHGILPGVQNKGVLDRLYTDMDKFEGNEPVPLIVPAGSVSYFHAHVIHGSKGNKTDQNRRAMVITYQPGGHNRWKLEERRDIVAH